MVEEQDASVGVFSVGNPRVWPICPVPSRFDDVVMDRLSRLTVGGPSPKTSTPNRDLDPSTRRRGKVRVERTSRYIQGSTAPAQQDAGLLLLEAYCLVDPPSPGNESAAGQPRRLGFLQDRVVHQPKDGPQGQESSTVGSHEDHKSVVH